MLKIKTVLLLFALVIGACSFDANQSASQVETAPVAVTTSYENADGLAKAYFASGCFWCVEAIFESVEGVKEAISGYSGGTIKNPTYSLISSGNTRHAETVEVIYDPTIVSYETLLKVFFGSHDPTTPDQQGPDRGPQYRSAVFYQTPQEKKLTEDYIAKLIKMKAFDGKITTEVSKLKVFYKAEDYHQDYEKKHPNNSYVRAVSIPRLKRFQAKYPELLKKSAKAH